MVKTVNFKELLLKAVWVSSLYDCAREEGIETQSERRKGREKDRTERENERKKIIVRLQHLCCRQAKALGCNSSWPRGSGEVIRCGGEP